MRFKKISKSEGACVYALTEDIDSVEYKSLVDWLDIHCPNAYSLSNMHLFITAESELFFELTFPLN